MAEFNWGRGPTDISETNMIAARFIRWLEDETAPFEVGMLIRLELAVRQRRSTEQARMVERYTQGERTRA